MISADHPNNSITEIGQNTEKSPGDLRRLALSLSLSLKIKWKPLANTDVKNLRNIK